MADQFLITTTGIEDPVIFDDLGGISFPHPTTDFDLASRVSLQEIYASADVRQAILAGYITAKDEVGNPIINTKFGFQEISEKDRPGGYSGIGASGTFMEIDIYDPTNVAGDVFDADNTAFDPDGDLISDNVQDAIVELRNDTDTKLSDKADFDHNHDASDITTGLMADARIAESNVTQHEGAIQHQNLNGAGTNTHGQIDSHISNTINPHNVTQSQIGLGNVTNDAQLKRSANDFNTFLQKTNPITDDILLIEDSENGGQKKYIKLLNFPQETFDEYAEDLTETSTTLQTYQNKLSLNLLSLPIGTYYVHYMFEWTTSSTSKAMSIRVTVDEHVYYESSLKPLTIYSSFTLSSGFFQHVNGSVQDVDIEIDYKADDNAMTAYIKEVRLHVIKKV
jgi:hypothetical protein